ncbi:hypothetical protein ACIP6V_27625, partial [Streptomyces sp. NPDC088770]
SRRRTMTSSEDRASGAGTDPYALALRSGRDQVYLRSGDGRRIRMPVDRWYAHPTVADESVLNRAADPFDHLDRGCPHSLKNDPIPRTNASRPMADEPLTTDADVLLTARAPQHR